MHVCRRACVGIEILEGLHALCCDLLERFDEHVRPSLATEAHQETEVRLCASVCCVELGFTHVCIGTCVMVVRFLTLQISFTLGDASAVAWTDAGTNRCNYTPSLVATPYRSEDQYNAAPCMRVFGVWVRCRCGVHELDVLQPCAYGTARNQGVVYCVHVGFHTICVM